jgi:hypothetical protein
VRGAGRAGLKPRALAPMHMVRSSRTVLLALLATAAALAIIRLPAVLTQVAHNSAERLIAQPIEDSVYDPATHFDCVYWGAGMTHVDPTMGHINHLHIGLTKAAAARRTSFWSAR